MIGKQINGFTVFAAKRTAYNGETLILAFRRDYGAISYVTYVSAFIADSATEWFNGYYSTDLDVSVNVYNRRAKQFCR